MGERPIFPSAPFTQATSFVESDGIDRKVVAYGNTGWLALRQMLVSSTDVADKDIYVYLRQGGTDYPLGRVTIPAGSGYAANTPPVNIIDPEIIPGLFSDPNTFLPLQAADQLVVQMYASLTLLYTVSVVCIGGLGET